MHGFTNFCSPVFNVLRRGSSAMCMLGGSTSLFFRPKPRFVGRGAEIFRLIERSKSSVRDRALHLPEYLNLTRPQSVSHGREEKRLRDVRGGGWEGRRSGGSFSLFLLPGPSSPPLRCRPSLLSTI